MSNIKNTVQWNAIKTNTSSLQKFMFDQKLATMKLGKNTIKCSKILHISTMITLQLLSESTSVHLHLNYIIIIWIITTTTALTKADKANVSLLLSGGLWTHLPLFSAIMENDGVYNFLKDKRATWNDMPT